jgi:hypothetical protein
MLAETGKPSGVAITLPDTSGLIPIIPILFMSLPVYLIERPLILMYLLGRREVLASSRALMAA